MKPLINWEELQALVKPPMPRMAKTDTAWRKEFADFYNKMAAMEKQRTLNQVNALPLLPEDTLLDMGCGPGRLSVPLAARVKSVTALDMSEDVLAYCRQNAQTAGLTNLTTQLMDFHEAVPGQNVEKHDVVICSRSVALHELRKLSGFAKRMAAIVTFANAPTIPQLLEDIFKDTGGEDKKRPPFRHGMDRRINYNMMYNIVYDMGYEPNVKIVEDGFTKDFATKEEAYADLITLRKVDEDRQDIFRRNLDPYLTPNAAGGYTFFIETRTCVMWWEINPKRFF